MTDDEYEQLTLDTRAPLDPVTASRTQAHQRQAQFAAKVDQLRATPRDDSNLQPLHPSVAAAVPVVTDTPTPPQGFTLNRGQGQSGNATAVVNNTTSHKTEQLRDAMKGM